MSEERAARSRRDLLAVAGAAAAAAVTGSLWRPTSVSAADPFQLGIDNPSPSETAITNVGSGAGFRAWSSEGPGVRGTSAEGLGVAGSSTARPGVYGDSTASAGVVGQFGALPTWYDEAEIANTGVYGVTEPSSNDILASGVWGDSEDIGTYGTGSIGVYGWGGYGVFGLAYGTGGRGLIGKAENTSQFALEAIGKVKFSRSGKTTVGAGKSSRSVTLAGVTGSSLVFALLSSSRSGRWVRAVVPAAGKFTVYLNTTVSTTTNVVWFILN